MENTHPKLPLTPSSNFAMNMLGSLIYGLLDTKLGITATLMAAGVSVPVLITSIGAFLGLEGWRVWKEAKNDEEKLKILKTILLSEKVSAEKQNQLQEEVTVSDFDNAQDHQRFVRLVRMLRQSIVEIRQGIDGANASINEVRVALQNHIETHDQIRKLFPINNLPYLSIRDLFKGRERELEDLRNQLGLDTPLAITQPVGMTGLGGIGKTRLAVELAWEGYNRRVIQDVFFVSCGLDKQDVQKDKSKDKTELTIEAAMERLQVAVARLADPLVLNVTGYAEKKTEALFIEVLQELQQHKEWLLILDNVDDYPMRDAVLKVLPHFCGGRVMITSRLHDWGDEVRATELKKLGVVPSREYLLQKTDKDRVKTANDIVLAEQLAGGDFLDGLPVALEQAACYICRMRINLAQYIQEYKDNQTKLLAWENKHKLPGNYPRPVLTTWQMTEQQLEPLERAMLYFSAFVAPDKIPLALFEKGSKGLRLLSALLEDKDENEIKTLLQQNEVINARELAMGLAGWSMIEFEVESFSVHRLVQEATRLRIKEKEQKKVCIILLQMMNTSQPKESPFDVRSWYWWKPMETHIVAAVNFGDIMGILEPTSVLINSLAEYYYTQARYGQAEPLMKRVLDIGEKSYGKEHPNVAVALSNLAQLYKTTNRLDEAERAPSKAGAIQQVSILPGQRIASRPEYDYTYSKVTNYAKL